ncbi:MAG: hypothetical protein V3S37_00895 [Dehalococcoidia bacterium]
MADILVEYFDAAGSANTDRTLEKAKARASELGIDTFVVASTRGVVGLRAAEYLQGSNVIIMRHVTGFRDPNTQEMPDDIAERILQLGAKMHTATHGFGGFGRAVRNRFNTYQLEEIVAETLRLFGAGLKVAIEISAMAADAGLIRTDEDVIAVAGGDGGADTAIVLRPSNVHRFFETRIREVICKPRTWG